MVAGSGCKVTATADWLAVEPVASEPVSGADFPDQQGRYREFARSRAVAVAVGAEQSRISIFLGLISLQAVTGNGIATSRELSGRSRARKPAEVCPEKGKPRGQRQRHDRAVPLGMSGRKGSRINVDEY